MTNQTQRKIITVNQCPSIPFRSLDWAAYYDGDEEFGYLGHGRTEQEAIDDLLDHFVDRG